MGRRWGCFGVVPKLEGSSPVFTPLFSPPQHADGTFCVKPLKQKQVVSALSPQGGTGTPGGSGDPGGHLPILLASLQVDGVSYLLQEIYGIENKYNTQDSKVGA